MRWMDRGSCAGAVRLVAIPVTVALAVPGTATAARSLARGGALEPAGRDVRPVRVASTSGEVKNAGALVGHAGGRVTLTRSAAGPDPVVLLDYGRDVEGFPYFKVSAGHGDPTMSAAYSETRQYLTPKGDNQYLTGAFGEDLHRYDTYRIDGAGVVRNERIQGAQRFQEIRLTTPGTVELTAVGIRSSLPRATSRDHQGSFVSSSDVLNRIWDSSTYTVRLDSMRANSEPGVTTPPVLVDGAKRDRKVWGGDLLTAAQTVYYSSGAGEYVKGSLAVLGRSQRPSGEISAHATEKQNDYWSEAYSMSWVATLAEYYRYTGDLRFVRDYWPMVQRELAWNASHVDHRGLLITNGQTWHPVDGQEFHGAITADNALYFHILDGASELATGLGHLAEATGYRARAAALKSAVNQQLFNPQTGDYDISDTRRDQTAQDADALAVLYGLAPADRVNGILRALRSRLWTAKGPLSFSSNSGLLGAYSSTLARVPAISPFASSLELWARLTAGDTSGALSLLRTLWGPMADPDNPFYTGTVWEELNTEGQPGLVSATSSSHAWGVGAASGLSAYVLGARPVSAGFRSWLVEPQPGDLAWAQGRVPTPHGDLTVRWRHRDDAFAMDVTAPGTTSGTIAVPRFAARSLTVRVNGRVVWDRAGFHPGTRIRSAHQDGRHVYLETPSGGSFQVTADLSG